MTILINLIAGMIFAAGLIIAGMTDPAKILNFLDVAGTFDPSLAFVLAGAVVTTFVGYRLVRRLQRPLFGQSFAPVPQTGIDRSLIAGATLFGAGWGLSGFCPGPALTSVAIAAPGTLVFVAAMFIGMAIARSFPLR